MKKNRDSKVCGDFTFSAFHPKAECLKNDLAGLLACPDLIAFPSRLRQDSGMKNQIS
jgi:hypothetical protein